jgi:cyclic-di-GMP-binding biofilm dispersal mediator protein
MAGTSLNDKVILVVGASGGLGTALVEGLRLRGATVLTASRSGEIAIDIRDCDAGDLVTQAIASGPGRLDGVINASGVVAFGALTDTSDVVIEELFMTNVMGPLWLTRRLLPLLTETQGFLVMISGLVAETPMPQMVAYSASKAALASAVTALRRELRRARVRVIDARPPHTETGLATRPLSGEAPKMAEGLTPTHVAERILAAIESGQDDLGSADF